MAIPVSLQEVVGEMEIVSDEMTAYINRNTGELYTLTDEDISYAEGDEDEEGVPDWQKEAISKAKEILDNDAWLTLPGKFEINEWEIMRDFAESQPDGNLAERLLRAIQGKGAFRYFKDVVSDAGLRDNWFAFRQNALERIAEEFLIEKQIPYKRSR